MRLMFDFRCKNQHSFEALVPSGTTEQACPECGATATRRLSAPTPKLEPFSGAFPGAYYRWNATRREKMKQELKSSK